MELEDVDKEIMDDMVSCYLEIIKLYTYNFILSSRLYCCKSTQNINNSSFLQNERVLQSTYDAKIIELEDVDKQIMDDLVSCYFAIIKLNTYNFIL